MKKIISFATFLLLISLAFAQTEVEGTTEEEFLYITKGYKIQQESGLDMKRGYFFRDLGSHGISLPKNESTTYWRVKIQPLYRESNPQFPCAIMMIIRKGVEGREKEESQEFYCIANPNSSREISLMCLRHFYNNIGERNYKDALIGYTLGLAQFTADLMELADPEKVKAYELKIEENRKEKEKK